MLRRAFRACCLLDDLLEIVLLSFGRVLVRYVGRAIVVAIAAAALAYWAVQPGKSPAQRALPRPVAAGAGPVDLSMPELDEVLDAELDRLGSLVTRPVPAVVAYGVTGGHASHQACIKFRGSVYRVRSGAVVPSEADPAIVVMEVRCRYLKILDVKARRAIKIAVTTAEGAATPLCFSVSAVAGGASSGYSAVVQYQGQAFIVRKGTFVPDGDCAAFVVADVHHGGVRALDAATADVVEMELQDLSLDDL
ncbi:MAG: hypothetical protein HY815_08215 [Candidatus Riflebacteria bacterium]|nr:hypothetical protein [Candidatus Riflebacteria bacterium]